MNDNLLDYIKQWLSKAKDDLVAARRLIEIEPYILDPACFHCQQAVEKFLKAYLVFKEFNFEKTHNIKYLLVECSNFDEDFKNIDVKNINDFAVVIRYPDDALMPDLVQAEEFLQIVEQVKTLVESKINLE
ncbi:MAG: HEPN domain-containing protein [Cytophagales bacterium]|nr:HEPN domain-containing protein [Cytophagales bacterium]